MSSTSSLLLSCSWLLRISFDKSPSPNSSNPSHVSFLRTSEEYVRENLANFSFIIAFSTTSLVITRICTLFSLYSTLLISFSLKMLLQHLNCLFIFSFSTSPIILLLINTFFGMLLIMILVLNILFYYVLLLFW